MSENIENENTASSSIGEQLYGKETDLSKLSKNQLIDRCQNWETLWSWLPEDVQFLVSKIGEECAFITTNEGAVYGRFMGFNVDIKEFKCDVYEQVYDHKVGRNFLEKNRAVIKKSYVTRYKWITEREEKKDSTE